MSEVKNIPRLRFPEFSDLWILKNLDSLSKRIGDGLHGTPSYVENSEYYFINGNNLSNGSIIVDTNTKKVSELDYNKNDKGLCDRSLLISLNGTIGSISRYNNEKVMLGKSVGYINFIQNSNFCYFQLQTSKIQNHFISELTGSTIKNLSLKTLRKTILSIPSLPEQQKIADFLTAVDKRIELLEKKKTLLETYKKGVMKKIFNQEIRFKDDNGNDFPDWEEKRLGDVGEFKTSSVDKKLDNDEQEVFLVNYMNVYRHEKITNENKHDLMVVTAKPNQIDSNNLLKGDILFTPSSETPDDIGHSVVIFENLENTLYSYHLLRFRPTIKIDILYSHYFCNNDLVLNQICRFATGSTRFTISKDSFSKILISLPCVEEQSKIARFLDSIDKQLELLESQIDKSKTWKKGLLQKMFV
ncbi:MAG: restriction endonuclease subunit S [Flavobacteriaceae bacterium]|nr:restriction endonuclease subunit S [Flavobacteriaceae bacterium]